MPAAHDRSRIDPKVIYFSLVYGEQHVVGLQTAHEMFPVATFLWHACLTHSHVSMCKLQQDSY